MGPGVEPHHVQAHFVQRAWSLNSEMPGPRRLTRSRSSESESFKGTKATDDTPSYVEGSPARIATWIAAAVCAEGGARDPVAGSRAAVTTIVTLMEHWSTPPHTPQLSTSAGGWQQMPDGGRGALQQLPRMSTATPWPPHTPQASTPTGLSQHTPSLSGGLSPEQHSPVWASMNPRQQAPAMSTMPSSHDLNGISHAAPANLQP